jgi:DNA-binding NarL/FixJ family response regulator
MFIAGGSPLLASILKRRVAELDDFELIQDNTQAKEVYSAVKILRPQVILLDVDWIGSQIITTIEKIKAGEFTPLVIAFSIYDLPQYRQRLCGGGADYFFDITSEFQDLVDLVNETHKQLALGNSFLKQN